MKDETDYYFAYWDCEYPNDKLQRTGDHNCPGA